MARKTKGKIRIQNVNALAELDRLGYKYDPSSENEVRVICPIHKDGKERNPSLCLNTEKNLWVCHEASCGAKGDIVSLLANILKVDRTAVLLDLSSRYDLEVKKTINPDVIEKFHKQIWKSGPLLKALYDRGITDDLIRKARLGYHGGRITIPVYDNQQRVVNVRRYLPGAPGPEKMKNTPGYGQVHLYQIDQLKYPQVWITGGEMKALVTGGLLNQHDIGAVSATAGERNWDPDFGKLFEDKIVYVCLDVDQGGLRGSQIIAGYIYHYVQSVRIVHLPLDIEKFPKGDINDYIALGATDQNLLELMQEAEQWYPPEIEDEKDDSEPENILLADATNASYVGKKIQVKGVITSMDTTPYLIAQDVDVSCTKDQQNCSWCPVKPKKPDEDTGLMRMKVKSSSQNILDMVNTAKGKQREALREALLIPPCKVVDFKVRSHYNVTDVRVSPQLHIGNESSKNVVQPAYCLGHGLEMNTPYILKGRVYPQPRTQQAVLLMNSLEFGEDSFSAFDPNKKQLQELKVFQPKEWAVESLKEKTDDIYADLETNVTRIFYRRDLHLAMDLCWHSALVFNFDDRETKGWSNILIIGDSSQGKSETAIRLMEHYGLGERVECKNASIAGLLGGLHQIGNRWFVSWGVIPTHDRRLVVLEEVKGADPEVIAKLTDMRSSGIAEIPKIEKRRAYARTRLIFISNPRSGRPISAYNFGIEAIRELMTGLEDIRRFDFALIVASSQVNPDSINRLSKKRPQVAHVYTHELCQRLLLWTWTRTADQIEFESEASDAILEYATQMSKMYTEVLPLVDRGTMRHKIARMAVALAARTFSVAGPEKLLVRKCHVEFVYRFLDRIYSDSVFGYKSFSEAQIHAHKVLDPKIVRKQILGTRYPADLVEHLMYADEITLNDLCDWCEVDKDTGKKLLSLLVRKHAVYRIKSWYVKTSEFIELLKALKSEGIVQTAQTYEEEDF